MTEKDYFKIKSFSTNKIDFLKVDLIIKNQEKLLSMIKEKYEKSNQLFNTINFDLLFIYCRSYSRT